MLFDQLLLGVLQLGRGHAQRSQIHIFSIDLYFGRNSRQLDKRIVRAFVVQAQDPWMEDAFVQVIPQVYPQCVRHNLKAILDVGQWCRHKRNRLAMGCLESWSKFSCWSQLITHKQPNFWSSCWCGTLQLVKESKCSINSRHMAGNLPRIAAHATTSNKALTPERDFSQVA